MSPKQQIQALLSQLPDGCSFEEIEFHLNSYGGQRRWPGGQHCNGSSHHRAVSTTGCRERSAPRSEAAQAFAAWQDLVSI